MTEPVSNLADAMFDRRDWISAEGDNAAKDAAWQAGMLAAPVALRII